MWENIEKKIRLYRWEKEWLEKILEESKKISWIEKIFLFWSRLNKKLSWWDIDLLIFFEKNFTQKTLVKWKLKFLFQEFCDTKLDLVEYDEKNIFFKTIKSKILL